MKRPFTFFLFFLSALVIHAADIPWKSQSSFQFAQNIPLKELLQNFFALQEINVVISEKVQGTVNGTFEELEPEEFMAQLSRAYNLAWFFDGNVMFINHSSEVETRYITTSRVAAKELLRSLELLGFNSPYSSIRILDAGGLSSISGPPGYVKKVSDISERLNSSLRISFSQEPTIKIFPLKYAWAYDTTFASREESIQIPGVATLLRGLMQRQVTGFADSNEISGDKKESKPRLVESKANKFEKSSTENSDKKDDATQTPSILGVSGETLIQPDMRRNAIIVRDVPERMPQYEEIINTLDVPTHVLEISASIVDLSENSSRELGNQYIDIQNPAGNRNLQLAPNGGTSSFPSLGGGFSSGFNIQGRTIIDSYTLLSQIQMLESRGKARTLSRPSVLTLDNTEATVSQSQTFYVPIRGTESTDLAEVATSTTLKVTPSVIEPFPNQFQIKLMVNIDDGSINDENAVDGIPRTANSSIRTQAVINEDQSLLIGGNYSQSIQKNRSGLPILKDIPILGALFGSQTNSIATLERMYVITPRIVNLSRETEPNYRKEFQEPFGVAVQRPAVQPLPSEDPIEYLETLKPTKNRKSKRINQS